MRSPATAVLLLLLALPAPLVGCGEKSEPETTGPVVPIETTSTGPKTQKTTATTTTTTGGGSAGSPEAEARKAIETFLTAGDPVVCEQYATARFVRSAYGDLKGCEAAQRPGSAASAVRITSLSVQGGSATATATPQGGTNGGEKLTIELVGQGGSWMIDSLRSNAPVGP